MTKKRYLAIILFVIVAFLMLTNNHVYADGGTLPDGKKAPLYYRDENDNLYTYDPGYNGQSGDPNVTTDVFCTIYENNETFPYYGGYKGVGTSNYYYRTYYYNKYSKYGVKKEIYFSEIASDWTMSIPDPKSKKKEEWPTRYYRDSYNNLYYTVWTNGPYDDMSLIKCEIYNSSDIAIYRPTRMAANIGEYYELEVNSKGHEKKYGVRHQIPTEEAKKWSTEYPTIEPTKLPGDGKREEESKFDLDSIFADADNFLDKGKREYEIPKEQVKKMSQQVYRTIMIIGIVVAFIVGGILAIQFITGGEVDKAEVKKKLIPYVIGMVVLFGSFTIWKIITDALQDAQSKSGMVIVIDQEKKFGQL